MPPKQSKPFSITTKDGHTTFFSSGSEIYLWVRKHKPQWCIDADKGIEYSEWNEGEVSTPEDIKACYERKK